ncbi:MAG: hypothetical protein RI907_2304 [Pseudomonadota bacterium]|jgi:hypothetical protein
MSITTNTFLANMGVARRRLIEHLRDILSNKKHGALMLGLFAVLITLPTLNAGMLGDDFLFRDIFSGFRQVAHPGALFGLYTFSDGVMAHNLPIREQGLVPWWVTENARMMFWRPISELTHWVDYHFWPDAPWAAHLQTVLWYGLLVNLLARLYSRLDPNPVRAHFSALIFAVAPTHMLAIVWVAARNQLIAACFIVLCIMAHHAWRQGGHVGHRLLAFALFCLGLASAEAGIASAAYLVAYAVCMERDRPLHERVLSVLPYLVVVVAWRVQYNHWGYGTSGLGGYIDPGRDPERFLRAVALRLPALLLAGTTGVTSTLINSLHHSQKVFYALGAAAALGGMYWLTRGMGLWRSPVLRFLGLGAVLALVPVCAAETNDRLLLNAEIGLSAILGTVVARLANQHRHEWLQAGLGAARRLAQGLTVVHLVIFPILMLAVTLTVGRITMVASHDEPMSIPNVPVASGKHLVLLDPPNALFVGYFQSARRYHGYESGQSLHALASSRNVVTMKVIDPYTIVLSGTKVFGDEVSRDLVVHPFQLGETVDAGPFVTRVLHIGPDGLADEVRFRFKQRLDDASLMFLRWGDDGYETYVMPPVGSEVKMGPGSLKKMVMHRLKAGL